jgi:hypothetical protein
MSILSGVLAQTFADRIGVQDSRKFLFLGYALGSKPVGLGITLALANREAEQTPPPPPVVRAPVVRSAPLSIATASLPDGKVGQQYSVKLIATGGQPPVAWAEPNGDLPASLVLNAPTGVVAGAPTDRDKGPIDIKIQATDATNAKVEKEFKFNITA